MKIKRCKYCSYYGVWYTKFCPRCGLWGYKPSGIIPLILLLAISLTLLAGCDTGFPAGYLITIDGEEHFLPYAEYGSCNVSPGEFEKIFVHCMGNGYATMADSLIRVEQPK